MTQPRRFHLERTTDPTGMSGTGHVADGVRWSDGSASLRWLGDRPSVVFWASMDDAEYVHTHGGQAGTRVVWDGDQKTARLARIAGAHHKHVDAHGGTTGECVECGETWPCPTWTWAATDRNPDATWDPADDEPPPACPAGLLPLGDGPVDRCIVEGPHKQHVTALGKRWTNPDDGSDQ